MKFKEISCLFAAAVSLIIIAGSCSTCPENSVTNGSSAREFLFGAELNSKDSDALKNLFYETGMNCIRLTGGGFAASVENHKKMADEFEARGMKVYMQLGSHCPPSDYLQLKEICLVDQDGKTGEENKDAMSISYSSEKFREKLAVDFRNYVDAFSKNRNIAGVILHDKPGYFWNPDRLFDYNADTIMKYRSWLEGRYATIGELNSRWRAPSTTSINPQDKALFAKFAEVVPSGKPPVQNIPAWLEWRRFNVDTIAGFMKWEADFFKSLRKDIPRTTNLDGPLNSWYGYRCADMQAYSKYMDRVGIEIHPTESTDRSFIPYAMDMLMGVAQDREGHVLDCDVFNPKQWKDLSEAQRARFLRSQLWTLIGHGASCILLSKFENDANANLPSGEFNERLLVCRDIAHYVKMIGVGKFSRKPSEVAVCVEPGAYLYVAGLEKKANQDTQVLDAENHGFYTAIADAGIQTDLIIAAQLRDQAAKRYKVLVLPSAMMMDAEIAETLKEYVIAGGMVIVDAPFAVMDKLGQPSDYMPNSGLNQLFGVNYDTKGEAMTSGIINSPQGKITVTAPIANLSLLGAEVIGLLENGKPGLTSKENGKGSAVLFAGRVGQSYIENPGGNALRDTLLQILGSVPVSPSVEISPDAVGKVDCSRLEDATGNLLVVVAAQGSKGKMPEDVKDVKLGIPSENPSDYRNAFILLATKSENGISRSGPEAIKVSTDGRKVSLSIGDVVSANPILIAKDMGPLLSAEALSLLKRGQDAEIKITCHNPSSKKLDGSLRLKLPSGFEDLSGKTRVSIEPFGQQAVVLKFKTASDKPIGRAVIAATLKCNTADEAISSIPLDLNVE